MSDLCEHGYLLGHQWTDQLNNAKACVGGKETESPEEQLARLADYIMTEIPGEPSQSEGAVDTAIRLLGER